MSIIIITVVEVPTPNRNDIAAQKFLKHQKMKEINNQLDIYHKIVEQIVSLSIRKNKQLELIKSLNEQLSFINKSL